MLLTIVPVYDHGLFMQRHAIAQAENYCIVSGDPKNLCCLLIKQVVRAGIRDKMDKVGAALPIIGNRKLMTAQQEKKEMKYYISIEGGTPAPCLCSTHVCLFFTSPEPSNTRLC